MANGYDLYPVADEAWFGNDPYANYFAPTRATAGGGYGQPGGPLDPWQAIISQGIEAARDVARGATSNYPYSSPDEPYARGGVAVYAPTLPPYPSPAPVPVPAPGGPPPTGLPGGIQLSTTTLMLLVGGALLFSLGKSRR